MRHAAFAFESVLAPHVQIVGGTAGQRAALRTAIADRLLVDPEPPTPAVIVVLPRPDSRGERPAVHMESAPADVLVIDPPEWYAPGEDANRAIALDEARQWLDFLAEHGIDPAGAAATAVAFAVAEQLDAIDATWADLGPAHEAWRFAGPGDSPAPR